MTELNYDTRMCEYGLRSYKIQFAGKSEYTRSMHAGSESEMKEGLDKPEIC